MKNKLILLGLAFIAPILAIAQDVQYNTYTGFDPHYHKVFPDKIFEIGLPMLFLYSVANLLVSLLKGRAENQLKMKLVDKGVSEETILTLFRENQAVNKLQPLKWGLFIFALGFSFILVHINAEYLTNKSGYLAMAIVLICVSFAFFIYYRILASKTQ